MEYKFVFSEFEKIGLGDTKENLEKDEMTKISLGGAFGRSNSTVADETEEKSGLSSIVQTAQTTESENAEKSNDQKSSNPAYLKEQLHISRKLQSVKNSVYFSIFGLKNKKIKVE